MFCTLKSVQILHEYAALLCKKTINRIRAVMNVYNVTLSSVSLHTYSLLSLCLCHAAGRYE